jgi:hypothetical protein
MGLRFQRRMTLVPGLRVNLSQSGASVSVGRDAWYTVGPRRKRRKMPRPWGAGAQ